MFDLWSFVRVTAFALFYAGIELRYVNRKDAEWTKSIEGFIEKPAIWKLLPYHVFFLLPLFVIAGYAFPVTAWAANVLWIVLLEDIAYFVWRGKWVQQGEWTTTLLGSFSIGGRVVSGWWIPVGLLVMAIYWVRF